MVLIKNNSLIKRDLEVGLKIVIDKNPPKMVSNELSSHQCAILLHNYVIEFSKVSLLNVNNCGKSFYETMVSI